MGRIGFGSDRLIRIPGKSGQYAVPDVSLDPKRLAAIKGPLSVNVNIVSARLSDPDNLLDCEFVEEPVATVRKVVPVIHCGLIVNDPDSPLH